MKITLIIWGAGSSALRPRFTIQNHNMITNKVNYIGWFAIVFLLIASAFCEFQIGNSWTNSLLDVVITFTTFLVAFNDGNKKTDSLQNQIDELQQRMKQMEDRRNTGRQSLCDVKILSGEKETYKIEMYFSTRVNWANESSQTTE